MICITAPYERGETTAMALQLASFATSELGEEVFIVPHEPKTGLVSSTWDTRVRGLDYLQLNRPKITHVIHFGVNPRVHIEMCLTQLPCRNILVPTWHDMPENTACMVRSWFSSYVVPNVVIGSALTSKIRLTAEKQDNVFLVPTQAWRTGLTPVHKPLPTGSVRKVAVLLDRDATINCTAWVLEVIDDLLKDNTNLVFTIYHAKRLVRDDFKRAKGLLNFYENRVTLAPFPELDALPRVMLGTDWVWLGGCRSNTGWFASLANMLSCPVVAWDTAPIDDLVVPTVTGLLVPCELRWNWVTAPSAILDSANFIRHVKQAFADDEIFARMSREGISPVSPVFAETWTRLLAPKSGIGEVCDGRGGTR